MEPQIPFGYKQVFGRSQKGDGRYDPQAGKFVKVKKEYPLALNGEVFIRKCVVVQQELIEEEICLD